MKPASSLLLPAAAVLGLAGCPAIMTGTSTGCESVMKAPSLWEILFPPAPTYRYLGSSWYDGKKLAEVSGEFSERSVSPSGRKLVFTGRESRDRYVLFLADIGGGIRKVAEVGNSAQRFSWTADEAGLFYLVQQTTRVGMSPGAPADVPGIPDGFTLWHIDLASGQARSLARLPIQGLMAVSPKGDKVALVGFGGAKDNMDVKVLSVESGETRVVASGLEPMPIFGHPLWSPDAKHFAALAAGRGASRSIQIFSEPEWARTTIEASGSSLRWSPDSTALNAVSHDGVGSLVRERVVVGSQGVDTATGSLGAPPAGKRLAVEWLMLSPDSSRAVMSLDLYDLNPGPCGNFRSVRWKNVVATFDGNLPMEVAPSLVPFAWLDDKRILFHSEDFVSQSKKLIVVDL